MCCLGGSKPPLFFQSDDKMSMCGVNVRERNYKRKILELNRSIKMAKKKHVIIKNKILLNKTLQEYEDYKCLMILSKKGRKKKDLNEKKFFYKDGVKLK